MLSAHLLWRLKALLDLNFADVQEMMQMRMSVCLKQLGLSYSRYS